MKQNVFMLPKVLTVTQPRLPVKEETQSRNKGPEYFVVEAVMQSMRFGWNRHCNNVASLHCLESKGTRSAEAERHENPSILLSFFFLVRCGLEHVEK